MQNARPIYRGERELFWEKRAREIADNPALVSTIENLLWRVMDAPNMLLRYRVWVLLAGECYRDDVGRRIRAEGFERYRTWDDDANRQATDFLESLRDESVHIASLFYPIVSFSPFL